MRKVLTTNYSVSSTEHDNHADVNDFVQGQ